MKYKIAWDNKSYSWKKIKQFRKQNRLLLLPIFLNPKFVIGGNFKKIKEEKMNGVIGYDSAGPLHIGSLVPLLILLETLKHYKINNLIITINDIEAMASRKVGLRKSKHNIRNMETVFRNVVKKYNKTLGTRIKIQFYVRSDTKLLWCWFSKILLISNIEQIVKKYYGKIPLNHLLSVLIMTSEFSRLSEKNSLLTCYSYEELLHLKFIEKIFDIINRKLYYVVCLPIRSITDKDKKMSKSDISSGLFLIPNNKLYFNKLKNRLKSLPLESKEGINQFLCVWSNIFKENISKNTDEEILKIIKDLIR